MIVNGLIVNNPDAVITNEPGATLTNTSNTITNYGTIDNQGTIDNTGRITNEPGGTIASRCGPPGNSNASSRRNCATVWAAARSLSVTDRARRAGYFTNVPRDRSFRTPGNCNTLLCMAT